MGKYREVRRKVTRTLAYWGVLCFRLIARSLSRPVGLRLGALMGELAFWLSAKDRLICYQNLDMVYQNRKTERQKRQIALECHRNLGRSAIEVLQIERYNADNLSELLTVRGADNYEKELREGRSVIFITAHIDNWELVPFGLCVPGDKPGAVIARRINNEGVDRLTRRMRERYKIRTFVRSKDTSTMREILKLVRRPGSMLGMVIDQDTKDVEGIFADFLGKPAFTMVGPAVLALRTGASLVPAFVIRQPDGRHLLDIHQPIRMQPSKDKAADIRKYTAELNRIVEKVILAHPQQWVWMHRRWKRSPLADDPYYDT